MISTESNNPPLRTVSARGLLQNFIWLDLPRTAVLALGEALGVGVEAAQAGL
jgi:hypothetical protein